MGLVQANLPRFPGAAALCEALKPVEPVYLLHPARFRAAAKTFLENFPGTTLYAVKANPAGPVLDQLHAAGIRHFDTASLGEVELVAKRFPGAKCHFMAPIRLPGAAGEAFRKYGVRDFVVDDEVELERLTGETKAPRDLTVFVRFGTAKVAGAKLELSSKFGADVETGAALLKAAAAAGCRPAVTFHVGSLCLRPEAYREALAICREGIARAGVRIHALDIGGGFPSPYPFPVSPPLADYFAAIKGALPALALAPGTPLYCEPGRALVAEAVSLLTLVVRRRGRSVYLNDGVHGSLDELTLPDWNVEYPTRVFSHGKEKTGAREEFAVFGPTCDTLDVLPRKIALPADIATGDYVEWEMTGAYSAALRTSFNGFYPDAFALIGQV